MQVVEWEEPEPGGGAKAEPDWFLSSVKQVLDLEPLLWLWPKTYFY